MAESVALTSIAKSALQLFTSLAKDEILLLWHSEEDLEKLRDTIEMISCCLQDAEKRKPNELLVQCWLSNLTKVMYDAEDLFDALAAHVLRKKTTTGNAFTKEVRLFFSESNQLGFFVKTAHEVKSLRESLDDISKNMHQLCFIQQPSPPLDQSFSREKTHSFVHQEDIIGRDEDKIHIINMLLPKDEGETSICGRTFSVVAIIGFGGLGKTALAQLVYNDVRVKHGFDECLWVCINYLSSLEQVLIEIIASKEGKPYGLGLEKLQQRLREIIGGKKFLLVLDDVWDENSGHWLALETILRCGERGSAVLVTTRSTKVAECLHALQPYCNLGLLSEEKAWALFVKRAFQGAEPSGHPELELIGKKILSKCGNVPLAIVTVGGLLAQKRRDERTWTEFYDNTLKEVFKTGDDNSLKQVLMVSYNDLHPTLKLCFAACSLFSKDYRFDKDHLVRLWLAQGILKPCADNEQSLEEVGEAYFFQLVDRCFFQEVDYENASFSTGNYCGLIEHKCTAKMHDLLHDMSIDVSKTENLFLDKALEKKVEIDGLRHISFDFDVEDSFDYCSLVSNPKTVRTLLFGRSKKFSLSTFKPLLESFKMLRTLSLSHSGIDVVPESIGGLIHLRYLDLSRNEKLKHLPDSICKLHHLMILILEYCSRLEKLPRRIEQLVSLRQLFIGGCDKLDSLPSGVKALTLLVNLDRLIVHHRDGGLGYLKDLDNLAGVLRIELPEEGWVDAVEDAKTANMARKNKLNEMVIEWKQRSTTAGEEKMAKDEAKAVLEALRPHEKFEYLRVENYGGEMLSSWFCSLRYVKELSLCKCDNVEYLEDGINGQLDFPSLQVLEIYSMINLKGWRRPDMDQGRSRLQLSTVSSVSIQECPKLRGQMPLFEAIEYLVLDRVEVEVVAELLVPNRSSQSSFSPLKKLVLLEIEGLTNLAEGWIRHLTALQELTIENCRELRRVSGHGLAHLTALKRLQVEYGEIGDEDDEMGSEAGMPWKALQGLEDLKVRVGDRNLLEGGLQYLTSLRILEIKMGKGVLIGEGEMKGVELPIKALQNLRKLSMGMDKETFNLRKSGILHLHSLNYLTIADCKDLNLSWKTLFSMKLLDSLSLCRVERVIDVEDETMMVVEQPSLLRVLCISNGAKWVDDIPWISLSSSLLNLWLTIMGEREQLPDGIQHLSSLRSLKIWRCEKLRSLPVWMPKLTSLSYLRIWGCSEEFQRRCERGTGEDWPLIYHVTYTSIRVKSCWESRNESRNDEEEEGSGKKGGYDCTPCWTTSNVKQ